LDTAVLEPIDQQGESGKFSTKWHDARTAAASWDWPGGEAGGGMARGSWRTNGGMATGVWEALQVPITVRIALTANGHPEVSCATFDIGTATCTIMTQVAAEMLGLPLESITINLGDSCRVSPAMNSAATCRLNATLCDRCFVMPPILRKPSKGGQFKSLVLSVRRGALQSRVNIQRRLAP
jgi:hypothetical protein